MPKMTNEEREKAKERARIRELQKGPDLEKYLVGFNEVKCIPWLSAVDGHGIFLC